MTHIIKYMLLFLGFLGGAYFAHWLMLFSIQWDGEFEECCLGDAKIEQAMNIFIAYSWVPVIGAFIGLLMVKLGLLMIDKVKKIA